MRYTYWDLSELSCGDSIRAWLADAYISILTSYLLPLIDAFILYLSGLLLRRLPFHS